MSTTDPKSERQADAKLPFLPNALPELGDEEIA